MRVLGAIDMAEGNSIQARIRAVSQMTFTDEDGHPRQFTWRTIQTWYSRYQKHGVTVMENQAAFRQGQAPQSGDRRRAGGHRKVLPKVHGKTPTRALLYRLCIEAGLLTRSQIAPNTFSRLVNQFEMLKPDRGQHQQTSAWPSPKPTPMKCGRPIRSMGRMCRSTARRCKPGSLLSLMMPRASAVTASSSRRKTWTRSSNRSAPPFTNAACRTRSMWTTAPFTPPRKSSKSAPASAACCITRRCAMARPRAKIERFFRTVRDQFLARDLDLSSLDALNRQFTQWVEEQYNAQVHSVARHESA